MTVRSGYLWWAAARARTLLVPLAALVLALIGAFADRQSAPGSTWALTALMGCALSAWLVGAVLMGEPAEQADMATVALGGRGGRDRMDLLLVGVVAGAVSVAFVGVPLLLGALGGAEVFSPSPRLADVLAALGAQLCGGLLGGTLGLLFAPPRVTRRATAFAGVLGTLLVLVAVSEPLGDVGGPVALAQALADARPGAVTGRELLGGLSCLALAAAAASGAREWARRGG